MATRGKYSSISAENQYIITKLKDKKRKKYKRTMPDGYTLSKNEIWGNRSSELKSLVKYASMPHSILSVIMDCKFFTSAELRVFLWIWRETFGKATYQIQYNFNLDKIVDMTGIKSKKVIRACLNSLNDRNIIRISYHTRTVQGAIQRYIPNGGVLIELVFDKTMSIGPQNKSKWEIDVSMWKDKEGVEIGIQQEPNDDTILDDDLSQQLDEL